MIVGDKYKVICKVVTNGGDVFEKNSTLIYNGRIQINSPFHEFHNESKEHFVFIVESQLIKFLEKIN